MLLYPRARPARYCDEVEVTYPSPRDSTDLRFESPHLSMEQAVDDVIDWIMNKTNWCE